MKKTFLFLSMMLLALFLIGCAKSKPTDLRLLALTLAKAIEGRRKI